MNKRTFIKSTILGTLGSIFFPMCIPSMRAVGMGAETSFPTTKLYVNPNVNVGLNTPRPMCKLHITGHLNMEKI